MRIQVLTLVAALLLALNAAHVHAKPPHVLLILADDLGWMDLRCQGNEALRTPRLDALAKQGVRFTDAYAASPVCSPTRAALMTGHFPARLHITQHGKDTRQFWPDNRVIQPPPTDNSLPLTTTTLAERLKDAGYATGFFGKWHLGDDEKFWPLAHGFDVNHGGCGYGGPPTYFDPYSIPTLPPRKKGEYLTDRLADETIAYMRSVKDKPMFLCLWTYNPHYPFEAPAELIAKYKGKEGPGLKNAIYGAQLEAMDRGIGQVLDELDRLKIADETIVIFTSDNGGWSGATDNRPLRAGKGYLYEGGLRVPLIVRWPGVTKADTLNHTPVISMDLTATILDATGVKLAPDEKLDGQTLRPLFTGGKLERQALHFHYPHFAFHKDNRPGSAMRMGRHKIILNLDDDSVELYDIDSDLGEKHDLASKQPELTKKMHDELRAWLNETKAGLPVKRTAEHR